MGQTMPHQSSQQRKFHGICNSDDIPIYHTRLADLLNQFNPLMRMNNQSKQIMLQ